MAVFSLLLLPFFVQILIHLVNTVGASNINELLWLLYSKVVPSTGKRTAESGRLRREVVRLQRELAAISAQDEFTKWAKMRRQLDKAQAEHDKQAEQIKTSRAKFDKTVGTLRWVGTSGTRFVLQFWFAKQPLFWIPQGWLPHYVEWILAFPRAPTGSISIQVWWIACATVISMVGEAVSAGITLVQREKNGSVQGKGQPMAMESNPTAGGQGSATGKKEL